MVHRTLIGTLLRHGGDAEGETPWRARRRGRDAEGEKRERERERERTRERERGRFEGYLTLSLAMTCFGKYTHMYEGEVRVQIAHSTWFLKNRDLIVTISRISVNQP